MFWSKIDDIFFSAFPDHSHFQGQFRTDAGDLINVAKPKQCTARFPETWRWPTV